MREYELTFIAKPDLDATSMTALIERVKGITTADGGTIVKLENWGMRHMTYPIRRFRDGQYVHMVVSMEGASVARVEQRLKLVEEVIRHLLVVADEDVVPAAAPVSAPALVTTEAPATVEAPVTTEAPATDTSAA
ncbi:MAG: 30S ribosomal protein S6 [Chloroflexi bacterium]|nr:30S ribosomal protein S6 [Chloroflexota bacterium]